MKLLLDANLSPKLVFKLSVFYPRTTHISSVGLKRSSDIDVWKYAKKNNFIIVTKDSDFSDFTALFSFPPKVIWLRLGNCTTAQILEILINNVKSISQFNDNKIAGLLVLI